jgi:hypothetical protein
VQLIQVKTGLIDEMIVFLREKKRWRDAYGDVAGRTCFEMCRTLAKMDIEAAVAYFHERRERDLVRLTGPAAPFHYRLAYWILGFGATEKLARFMR